MVRRPQRPCPVKGCGGWTGEGITLPRDRRNGGGVAAGWQIGLHHPLYPDIRTLKVSQPACVCGNGGFVADSWATKIKIISIATPKLRTLGAVHIRRGGLIHRGGPGSGRIIASGSRCIYLYTHDTAAAGYHRCGSHDNTSGPRKFTGEFPRRKMILAT